ncbi:unnamed protein product [Caenorhabditis nigoni]
MDSFSFPITVNYAALLQSNTVTSQPIAFKDWYFFVSIHIIADQTLIHLNCHQKTGTKRWDFSGMSELIFPENRGAQHADFQLNSMKPLVLICKMENAQLAELVNDGKLKMQLNVKISSWTDKILIFNGDAVHVNSDASLLESVKSIPKICEIVHQNHSVLYKSDLVKIVENISKLERASRRFGHNTHPYFRAAPVLAPQEQLNANNLPNLDTLTGILENIRLQPQGQNQTFTQRNPFAPAGDFLAQFSRNQVAVAQQPFVQPVFQNQVVPQPVLPLPLLPLLDFQQFLARGLVGVPGQFDVPSQLEHQQQAIINQLLNNNLVNNQNPDTPAFNDTPNQNQQ